MKKLLVVAVAGLGDGELSALNLVEDCFRGAFTPPFPAVTATAQAVFRTGAPPASHGVVCNGFFDRALRRAYFWEQSARLVEGARLWDAFRSAGKTVGMMFWQQSLGEHVDLIVSPAPIHKHHGGMVMDCYTLPSSLYQRLRQDFGEFPLYNYWGPLARPGVGDWIAQATASVMFCESPDLLLSYLPTLDYDFQRFGPDSPQSAEAVVTLAGQIAGLIESAEQAGYDWLFWGDYAVERCAADAVIYPNRLLRDAELFRIRDVRGRWYPDLFATPAFALVDHAIAHVYVQSNDDLQRVSSVFENVRGIERVCSERDKTELGLAHCRAGDLVLVAEKSHWFAYPWWEDVEREPDYARHVDIHNKPGFDPCELIMQWVPPGVEQDASRIGGTHGRTEQRCGWASNRDITPSPATLYDLANAVRRLLSDS